MAVFDFRDVPNLDTLEAHIEWIEIETITNYTEI